MMTGIGACLLVLAVAPVAAVKPKPAVSLSEIAAGLRAWRTQIDTMHLQARWRSTRIIENERTSRTWNDFTDWAWSKTGKTRRYYRSTTNGKTTDYLNAHGERYRFHFDSPGGDPPKTPGRVRIAGYVPSRSRALGSLAVVAWNVPHFGLAWWSGSRSTWLDEMIDGGHVRLAGTEMWDGRKLPVLEVSSGRNDGRRHRITVDPQHGFLVKKSEFYGNTYIIEEFRKISPPGVWFPVKGFSIERHVAEREDRTRWRVTSIELNVKFDESLFLPKIPPGSNIEDFTRGRVFTPKPPPKEASPHDRIQMWLAWMIGVAFAAAGVWICVRTWRVLRSSKPVD